MPKSLYVTALLLLAVANTLPFISECVFRYDTVFQYFEQIFRQITTNWTIEIFIILTLCWYLRRTAMLWE